MAKKKTEGTSDLISQADAARLTGLTRAAISYLVTTGTLSHTEVAGKKLVYKSEVSKYKPTRKRTASKKSKAKK